MTSFQQAGQSFIAQLTEPDFLFSTTLEFVEQWFEFNPTAFHNGNVQNSAEQNQGSCKVLALAEYLNLDNQQTLLCFGEHFRDVLATPDVDNHHNLRRLQRDGRTNIQFDQFPLIAKS